MTMGVVWNCLAYANSCVNPIIYNYTCKDFREAFRSVVHSCCPCCCVQTDDISEVDDGADVDDDNDDNDEQDNAEPAIELQLQTDVTVVGHIRPIGCNQPKAVPVVRLETTCTADISSV